jgi:hypothetical protein
MANKITSPLFNSKENIPQTSNIVRKIQVKTDLCCRSAVPKKERTTCLYPYLSCKTAPNFSIKTNALLWKDYQLNTELQYSRLDFNSLIQIYLCQIKAP